ncbi:hypothetical protein EDD86DRAFT_269422 [Gorgonomyces haynaldii]|nr:hypothetical protein EDD86DRAFT_269422 [Gorgonomyces haynaldii]
MFRAAFVSVHCHAMAFTVGAVQHGVYLDLALSWFCVALPLGHLPGDHVLHSEVTVQVQLARPRRRRCIPDKKRHQSLTLPTTAIGEERCLANEDELVSVEITGEMIQECALPGCVCLFLNWVCCIRFHLLSVLS